MNFTTKEISSGKSSQFRMSARQTAIVSRSAHCFIRDLRNLLKQRSSLRTCTLSAPIDKSIGGALRRVLKYSAGPVYPKLGII